MLEYAASLPWGWIIPVFFVLGYTVAAVALVHALLKARRPQSALGWAAAIISLPFAGSLAYFLFGISRVDSRAARLMGDRAARRLRVSSNVAGTVFFPVGIYSSENFHDDDACTLPADRRSRYRASRTSSGRPVPSGIFPRSPAAFRSSARASSICSTHTRPAPYSMSPGASSGPRTPSTGTPQPQAIPTSTPASCPEAPR